MKKLKVKSMSSESYPGGRLDSYELEVPEVPINHSHIIPLFIELGFSREDVNEKLDLIYKEYGEIFIYGGPDMKAYVYGLGNMIRIKFDTSFSRGKMDAVLGKYFEFPK